MSSTTTTGSPYPPQIGESVNSTDDNSKKKSARSPVSHKPKPEAVLRALIENTKDAFILFDCDGNVIAFNQIAIELYREHNNAKLTEGTSIYDLVSKERHEPTRAIFESVLMGQVVERTMSHISKERKTYYFKRYFKPVRSEDGKIYAVSNTITDITREVEAQAAIQKSESNLRAIFDNARDGFVLIDLETKVLAFNHSAAKLYDKVMGKTLLSGNSVPEILGPQLGDNVRTAFEKVITGESVERKSKQHGSDGKEYWLGIFYSPVRSLDGMITGLCMGISDITLEVEANIYSSELAAIVISSDDAIISKTLEGIVTSWNPAAEKMFGYSAKEMIGESITKLIPADRLGEEPQILERLRKGERIEHFETIRITKKGNPLNISLTISPINNGADVLIGASKIARNITVQKRLQDKLRESEKHFREELEKEVRDRTTELREMNEELAQQKDFMEIILDSSIDQICIYDKETHYLACNQTFLEENNIRAVDILGKTFLEVNPTFEDSVIYKGLLQALEGHSSRTVWKSPDNGHTYTVFCTPSDPDNEMYGAMVSMHDNTEIIEAVEKLQEFNLKLQTQNDTLAQQNEFIETVLDASVDQIVVVDKDMRFLAWNKKCEEHFGMKRADIIGKTYSEIFPGFVNSEGYNEILKALQTGKICYRSPRKSPLTDRIFDAFIIPLEHNKKVYAALSVSHDVTDIMDISEKLRISNETLEEKNNELKRSNSELERFAYAASHDLQEPLRKIKMFAGRIREHNEKTLDEKSQSYFNKIDASSERMSSLIKDILNYSSMNIGAHTFECTDLNDVIKLALDDFDLVIEEKKAKIEIEKLPEIEGIPAQLNQLFHNLIGNGLKFSKEGVIPNIHITSDKISAEEIRESKLDSANSYYEIIVRDNGIGFDQVFAEKIFVIFQRLNDREKYGGTGIGLALCRKIVDNHNGIIYAESKEGEGAEFHIILPEKQNKV